MTPSEAVACCAYCGLPVPAPLWPRRDAAAAPAYCCYGCRFAAAVTGATGAEGHTRGLLTRLGIALFFAMNVMAFTMALWTQDVYGEESTRLSATIYGLFRYLCLFFSLPVLLLLGGPLWDNAWDGVKRGAYSTDLLLLAGVAAAFGVSAASVFRDDGPVYFEVACAVLVLVTLGRWLEARGKLQATEAIEALAKLLPETVRVVEEAGERSVPRREARVGARLRVLAGERIPCDGVVLCQAVTVDEQLLTGEALGCVKEPGDLVRAGTLNLDGDLRLEVRAESDASTLARLVRLMREARLAQGPYERLAERLARWFLPAVVMIALLAAAVHGWQRGFAPGIMTGLAVVLIACPCALGVATPLAVWAALGRAAQQGVLFRSGEVLERLASIRVVALDKTGTLTTGQARLRDWRHDLATPAGEVWRRTLELAGASTHGLARALVEQAPAIASWEPEALARESLAGASGAPIRTLPGRGLQATDSRTGTSAFLGSTRLMEEQGQTVPATFQAVIDDARHTGRSMALVAWGGQVRGMFVFEETVRWEATAAFEQLRRQGMRIHVLTGDHRQRGEVFARTLGVPVDAELLPEDKLALLARLRAEGAVAMVGDGINDGPALATSDVGIALGCGADVARAAAGVCLLGDDLLRIPWAIDLARRTVRIIRQNLFWAVAYNVMGIGLACTGRLNPVWAALAMTLSGVMVLVNSLRLARADGQPPHPQPLSAEAGGRREDIYHA